MELKPTDDGSTTLFLPELGETYHSRSGAWSETCHVFIKHGFQHYFAASKKPEIRILEFGFGTGLNALASLAFAKNQGITLHYQGLEKHPVPQEILNRIVIPDLSEEDTNLWKKIHAADWNQTAEISPHLTLLKSLGDVREMMFLKNSADIVFFDFFAPAKVPELWTVDVLKIACNALCPGGIFVTYAATGQLKRDLKSLGLTVEALKGFGTKREMVRGTKL